MASIIIQSPSLERHPVLTPRFQPEVTSYSNGSARPASLDFEEFSLSLGRTEPNFGDDRVRPFESTEQLLKGTLRRL